MAESTVHRKEHNGKGKNERHSGVIIKDRACREKARKKKGAFGCGLGESGTRVACT